MSKDINQMDFKELRNEVQRLRDELAIMQRKYEDILYNLDDENLGSKLKEEFNSKISSDEAESMISQTADEISTKVSNVDGRVSSVSQSVSRLSSRVTSAEGVTSEFIQTAYGFTLDGERVTFTGVIYLTDNNGVKKYSFFHDQSQGYPQIILHSVTDDNIPLVLGDYDGNVYVSSVSDGNEVATRSWVENNCTAKFG